MKKIYNLIWILTLGLFMAACDSDDAGETYSPGIVKSNVSFTAQGGTGNIETLLENITVTSNQDWCAATPSGKTVSVTVPANTDLLGRTAVVTIHSGTQSIAVPVSQEGARIVCEQNVLSVSKAGITQKLFINSNLDWTPSIPDTITWCSVSRNADTLTVSVSPNDGKPRSTVVSLTGSGIEYATLSVQQKGELPVNELFTTSQDKWYFSSAKMSPMFKQFFDGANTELRAMLGVPVKYMYLCPDAEATGKGSHEYTFLFGDYRATYYFDAATVEGTKNQVQMTFTGKVDNEENGTFLYTETENFKFLVTLMVRNPFTIIVDDADSPTTFTFTDTNDPRVNFILTNTKVLNP